MPEEIRKEEFSVMVRRMMESMALLITLWTVLKEEENEKQEARL